jgi:integrase
LAKPIWCSADTRQQLHRYIARDRSEVDPHRRTRLEQLGDDEPIFLSRRKRQLEYSGFGIVFKRLLSNAQRHFGSAPLQPDAIRVLLPTITPHTIRHLHTTFRVKKVRELFSSPVERERALEALVDDLGWRSAEMLKTYDHAITRSELKELMASSVRQMLQDAPHDADSLHALLRRGAEFGRTHTTEEGESDVLILSDEARKTLAWIEALGEK